MAKRKQKSIRSAKTPGFGKPNLDRELTRVVGQAAKGDWKAACNTLILLSQEFPNDARVWEYLADASFEVKNIQLYQKACEKLFELEPKAKHAYLLGAAYLANLHPLMALTTLRQAVELDPNHESAPEAKATIKKLEPRLDSVLAEMGLTEEDGLEIALLHERGQACLEQGDYAASRAAEEKVLARHPEFSSARNNLSLLSWIEGDVDAAIATAQQTLQHQPDNIHALANLIHFSVLSGDNDTAQTSAERLKASQADAWDGWTKKVEGLSYLADDESVVEVWKQAQADNVDKTAASSLFYHLAAVALARTGKTNQAIAQWKAALKRQPSFSLAQENLNDIRKPVSQQHGAWPFNWDQWLPPQFSQELRQRLQKYSQKSRSGSLTASLGDFLNHHPEAVAMFPRVLERGGPAGQEFILTLAEQLNSPELLNMVKDFALSQNGTDQMRSKAANLAAQANLIPKDKVTLWMGGQWHEIMLLAYEFHDRSELKHAKPVEKLLKRSLSALYKQDPEHAVEAESLLREALEREPAAPDLLNNLAAALEQQGRIDEANALTREIVQQHPDYVPAAAALARLHLLDEEVEAAEAILKPFLSREQFHFQDFGIFSHAYIDLLMAKNEKDGARSWLNLWEQVYPDDPKLSYWKKRLSSGIQLPKLFR